MAVKTKKQTILVVEDEVALRGIICKKLALEEFVAREAGDGEEGLEIALNEHPDLILLDIIMPVMDGMTMIKRLRVDAWGKTVKIILLTNLSDSKKVAEAVGYGVRDYIVKSDWKMEQIVVKVKSMLKKLTVS